MPCADKLTSLNLSALLHIIQFAESLRQHGVLLCICLATDSQITLCPDVLYNSILNRLQQTGS
jgi:hypothetical protein